MTRDEQRRWGQIGGLTAHSRHDSREMTQHARNAFQDRFRRQVDPDNSLPSAEREKRAERAMRAYMLTLAAKSARIRARLKAAA